MDIYRYLRVLKKRLWLILFLTIIGGVATFFFTLRQTPTYEATVALSINPRSPSVLIPFTEAGVGSSAYLRLANTYTELLKGRTFTEGAVERLQINAPAWRLALAIGTRLVPETTVYKITVAWDDPQEVARIANGVADIFLDENRRIQEQAEAGTAASLAQLRDSTSYYQGLVDDLRRQRDTLMATTMDAETKRRQLADIEQRMLNTEATLQKYSQQLSDTQAALRTSLNTATVIDPAVVPARPVSPNLPRNVLFGVVFSLLVSMALVFLLEYLDQTVKTPEDLGALVGKEPLAMIGVITGGEKEKRRRRRRSAAEVATGAQDGYDPKLITIFHPKDHISEAYRALRTNLQFVSMDRPVQSLLVTSAIPGEGKTLTVANLGVALAQAGRRVILVDSDLRRPSLHRFFRLPNTEGFTSLLLKDHPTEAELEAAVHPTGVANLWLLPSGPLPPNPSEVLMSHRTAKLLEELRRRADYLLFDSPPVGPLTDAAVLASRVDGVLVVVQAAKCQRQQLQTALMNLKNVEANVVGTVLNQVRPVDLGGYGYYPYYYYYAYARERPAAPAGSPQG